MPYPTQVHIFKGYKCHVLFPELMEIGHILFSHQSHADFPLPFSKCIFELDNASACLVRASGHELRLKIHC